MLQECYKMFGPKEYDYCDKLFEIQSTSTKVRKPADTTTEKLSTSPSPELTSLLRTLPLLNKKTTKSPITNPSDVTQSSKKLFTSTKTQDTKSSTITKDDRITTSFSTTIQPIICLLTQGTSINTTSLCNYTTVNTTLLLRTTTTLNKTWTTSGDTTNSTVWLNGTETTTKTTITPYTETTFHSTTANVSVTNMKVCRSVQGHLCMFPFAYSNASFNSCITLQNTLTFHCLVLLTNGSRMYRKCQEYCPSEFNLFNPF
ncbi:unnamed protein product [Lepeophtheirus salmonis]|uniref:(salmon louse) hypothetical protein n=1 Tax=Lepeophtheirus salmonis TaxID=72036 RepID=A0A7R8CPH6_LEPSM|nr:unnamed protein product [Lepeophtheirus salmonis]CAF2883281.1 unnamed protein product [Lepeophtheirus salmonis]